MHSHEKVIPLCVGRQGKWGWGRCIVPWGAEAISIGFDVIGGHG